MTDSFCVAFSPDGKTLAVGTSSRFKGDSDANGNSYVVLLWDWRTKKHLRSLRGHAGAIRSIAFSPDGEYIASASDEGTAKLWDTETGICVRTITKSSPQIQVAFSPDGKTLACTGNPLTLIDLSTGRIKRTFPASNIVAFSSDSSTLASQVNGQIKLWRLK
jgi:WD40 repeat protein